MKIRGMDAEEACEISIQHLRVQIHGLPAYHIKAFNRYYNEVDHQKELKAPFGRWL